MLALSFRSTGKVIRCRSMSASERSFYEIQKSVTAALGNKVRSVGFRQIEMLNVPDLYGQKVHVVLDLNLHASPIYGMGQNDEHAADDAIRRNGTGYAYVLRLSPYTNKMYGMAKKWAWDLAPGDIVDLPQEDSLAISTRISRFDLQALLKKLKASVRVTLV